jgi:hypothetical protein
MLIPATSHWSYMEFHPTVRPDFDIYDEEEGLYEVVVRRHPNPKLAWTRPVFYTFPEISEWRTRDLMRRCTDPGFQNLWKYEGRLDDIMILNNGLKVNPLHIETRLQGNAALKGALVFGEGYNCCGLLIEGKDTGLSREELVDLVLPALRMANEQVPEHARISPNMILVASPEKLFPRSSKGTVIRKLTVRIYKDEIEAAYKC